MARPLRISYPDAYYHVTCRGNERRNIFKDDSDRSLFLNKLKTSLEIYSVKLDAYVLMDNHFHLIVQTPKANLSDFMRHFNIAYTGAFNRRHKRVGHLYQGRYKAILVEKDSYLLELSRYVHLNPVRINSPKRQGYQQQIQCLDKYPWSSLKGYLESSCKQHWVNYEDVLSQVAGSRSKYREFVEEGIKKGYGTPWEDLKGQVVLGKEEFVGGLKGRLDKGRSTREQPSAKIFETISADEVLSQVSRNFEIKVEELSKKRTKYRDFRAIAMELMYRHSNLSQAEIGKRLGGLDYSAVSRERKRLREGVEANRNLKRLLAEVEDSLNQR